MLALLVVLLSIILYPLKTEEPSGLEPDWPWQGPRGGKAHTQAGQPKGQQLRTLGLGERREGRTSYIGLGDKNGEREEIHCGRRGGRRKRKGRGWGLLAVAN